MTTIKHDTGTAAFLFSIAVPAGFVLLVALPQGRALLESFTLAHPCLAGFVKFALLATAGEILSVGLTRKKFAMPYAVFARAIVWGFLGVVITLVFRLFGAGVRDLMSAGLLPGLPGGGVFMAAFWTSATMNVIFAPTMMASHRVFDAWLDLKERGAANTGLVAAVSSVDWGRFASFVVCKTIPLFWIPAHTATFLLPEAWRVLVAAFLSLALGGILAFAARRR